MQSRFVVPAVLLALLPAACSSGGGSSFALPAAAPAPLPAADSAARLAPESAAATRFTFARGAFVSPSARSATVTLAAVNGAPPPGRPRAVTTDLTACRSACSLAGPPSPAGRDRFTLALRDAAGGHGSLLAVAETTLTVTAGKAAGAALDPRGVPASFALAGLPAAQAGVPFAAPQPVAVIVRDAGGNPIAGRYASTVWLDDVDPSGATSFLATGADAPPAGRLYSSADTVALAYDGLAIAPVTLMVSALNSTTLQASFAPQPGAIAYQGPTVGGKPRIDLFATAGTGSAAGFSLAEAGWSTAPFGKPFSVLAGPGCAAVATVSPASGTAFTVRAAAAAAPGSCTLTVSDGLGRSLPVTVTYATTALSAS